MCRGAATGAIDFAQADPRDRRWWRKLTILADQIEDAAASSVRALNHRMATALLSRPDLSDESIDRVRGNADALVRGIKAQLFPWVAFDDKAESRRAIEALHAQWVREWGDPADVAVAARIDATVASLAGQLERATARPPRPPRRA